MPGERERVVAGADAGGTHTTVVVAAPGGSPIAHVTGEPGALVPQQIERSARAIRETLDRALTEAGVAGRPAVLVVGAAGAGRETEREALRDALGNAADRVDVTTDAAIALEGAFGEGPGILIASGTGSIGYARDADGRVWRVGGLGWQLGDEGSGYALGRAALSAVGKAADGRGPRTTLSRSVLRAVGADGLDDLVRWAAGAAREEIAALAEIVCAAANEGDAVAGRLVEDAGRDLARHVEALRADFPPGTPVRVAVAGRVLASGSPVRGTLTGHLAGLQDVTLSEVEVDAAAGALAMARRLHAAREATR